MKIINTVDLLKSKAKAKYTSGFFLFFICALVSALVFSCAQDSLFADISVEPEPRDPMIPGTLTDIVPAKENDETYLYMAGIGAQRIFRYKGLAGGAGDEWSVIASNGQVISLAAGGEVLYALSGDRMNASLWGYKEGDSATLAWEKIEPGVAEGFSLQSLYGDGDAIFAGGSKGRTYSVFYTDGESPLAEIWSGTTMLTGAAETGGVYYLAAGESGILKWDGSATTESVSGVTGNVTGIKNVSGGIIAVTDGGSVLKLNGGEFKTVLNADFRFTGGMGVWKEYDESANTWEPRLLLLGIHSGGSYNKGYREIPLDGSGNVPDTASWQDPGNPGEGNASSISENNRSKYEASIERYGVYHIIQVPNEVSNFPNNGTPDDYKDPEGWEPVVFAATVKDGLMSLRGGLWNNEPK